jgi:integrase
LTTTFLPLFVSAARRETVYLSFTLHEKGKAAIPNKRKPSYLLHKSTDQARVRINGVDHYLGSYGSPESRQQYEDLIDEWFARNGDTYCYRLTVDDLAILFMQHAGRYYVKNGRPTCEVTNIRIAMRPLIRLFGTTRVRDFGPLKLKDVRNEMIRAGNVRTSINRQVGRIKRMFRWGLGNELVPASVVTVLSALCGLRKGRSDASELNPVLSVPMPFVNAVKPFVSRQVWAMIQLQLLTRMRPGEVVMIRGCDINMSGKVWEYVPGSHKTGHHGKSRIVFIGPKAQLVVREFLKRNVSACLFSPRDVREEFDAHRRA